MFATTQAEIARSLGVDVLRSIAIHNIAAAFLLMASQGKVEMAVQLAPSGTALYQRQVQLTVLAVSLVVSALALVNITLYANQAARATQLTTGRLPPATAPTRAAAMERPARP